MNKLNEDYFLCDDERGFNEFTLTDERVSLENHYRFSFDLAKFPRQVLKDIVEMPTYFEEETIAVSIMLL